MPESSLEIHCGPDNPRSAAVARKLGYTNEATLQQQLALREDRLRDTTIWTLIAADYPHSPAASTRLRAYNATEQRILYWSECRKNAVPQPRAGADSPEIAT